MLYLFVNSLCGAFHLIKIIRCIYLENKVYCIVLYCIVLYYIKYNNNNNTMDNTMELYFWNYYGITLLSCCLFVCLLGPFSTNVLIFLKIASSTHISFNTHVDLKKLNIWIS